MLSKDEGVLAKLRILNSSIVHDALKSEGFINQTLPSDIRPLSSNHVIFGRVWTLLGKLHSGISTHESLLSWTSFLSSVESNTVIVCQPNNQSIALMGELSAETLVKKNIRGYVVDGGCRDVKRIKEIGFPVFCKFYTPKDVSGRWKVTEIGKKIKIKDVIITTGDYIIGDEDGIVVIPKRIVEKIIFKAEKDLKSENKMRNAILSGEDPREAYLKYGKF
jgi:regulator of RNase E activity RraA